MASSGSSDDHHHDEDEEHCLQLMMSSKVCITETVVVSARAASLPVVQPPQVISLSNLDRQCPLLMYLVLFYNNPTTSTSTTSSSAHLNWSLDSIFQSFKSGLEETLSIWYPAAGRLISSDDDDDDNNKLVGGLNLLCNNKGCVLAKATTAIKISELGDLSHYNHFFENLVCRPPSISISPQHLSQMPLVAAQDNLVVLNFMKD